MNTQIGNNSGNIIMGGILTECNEFSINLMTQENFDRYEYFEDEKILTLKNGVVGGMLSILNKTSFNISPTVFASCSPGGVITDECYFNIKDKIISKIEKVKDIKAIILPMHGAAVTETIGDLEGDMVTSIRKIVGPEIPIVVTLDLHAHVTEEMVSQSSAIIAWETYPHLDPYETGIRGAKILQSILEDNIKPTMFFSKVPLLHSAINASTFGNTPFAKSMNNLKEEEKNNKDVLSTSFIHVDPYIDQKFMGGGAIVITNNNLNLAKEISLKHTKDYWDRRQEFEPNLYKPDEAILKGLSKKENILLVETADACGGGAAGDSVNALKKLIDLSANQKSLVHVVDPEAIKKLEDYDVGQKCEINLGHNIDNQWGYPIKIKVKIEKITDGQFTYNGGIWNGMVGNMGPSVLVTYKKIHIIISSYGTYEWNCEQFLSFNLDLDSFKFIVVKNPMNYKNSFKHYKEIYVLDTPGPTPPTCKHLKFKKMNNYFPKNTDLKFEDILLCYHN